MCLQGMMDRPGRRSPGRSTLVTRRVLWRGDPAMKIAVLIKQVPDTWSERTLRGTDWTLDRDAADAVIDEIDTRGVETALQLVEKHGGDVTVVTMGPERATEALRKALAMGATEAVHITDEGLAGSCA